MSKDQLQKDVLSLEEGIAYTKALDKLLTETEEHGQLLSEDYIVTVACEEAEGLYVIEEVETEDSGLEWQKPDVTYNQHLEIAVQDRDDSRFIPYLNIMARLYKDGAILDEIEMPFVWHPFVHHYGENIVIPEKGQYSVELIIKRPTFRRHAQIKGKRYEEDVKIMFGPFLLKPGRKEYGSE